MGIELSLFIIVGGIAILAAVMMLISDNAVHSALFLILNFACVAFLYLMLNAAFLAMVQVTVYAGAIMVLFLFVIMLLGAEKLMPETEPRYPWLVPAAVTGTIVLLLLASIIILESDVDGSEAEPSDPQLRIIHAAGNINEPVDLYLLSSETDTAAETDEELETVADEGAADNTQSSAQEEVAVHQLATEVEFRDHTELMEFEAGDYELLAVPHGAAGEPANALLQVPVFLSGNDVTALLLLPELSGTGVRSLAIPLDLNTVEERHTARVTVINALPCREVTTTCPQALEIADRTVGSDDPFILVEELAYGQISEVQIFNRDTYTFEAYARGAVDEALEVREEDADLELEEVQRLREYELTENTSLLWIITSDVGNQVNPQLNITIEDRNRPAFGGPEAVGWALFTDYLLPFEIVAILLLASMIGVIIMTKGMEEGAPRPRKERRMANVPGNPTIREYMKSMREQEQTPRLSSDTNLATLDTADTEQIESEQDNNNEEAE